jgi:hypothetical protein
MGLKVNFRTFSSSSSYKLPLLGFTSKTPCKSNGMAFISKYQFTVEGEGFDISTSINLSLAPSYV